MMLSFNLTIIIISLTLPNWSYANIKEKRNMWKNVFVSLCILCNGTQKLVASE